MRTERTKHLLERLLILTLIFIGLFFLGMAAFKVAVMLGIV